MNYSSRLVAFCALRIIINLPFLSLLNFCQTTRE